MGKPDILGGGYLLETGFGINSKSGSSYFYSNVTDNCEHANQDSSFNRACHDSLCTLVYADVSEIDTAIFFHLVRL